MKYFELIKKRKSIRDFKDKNVSAELIEEIKAYFTQCKRLTSDISTELLALDSDAKQKLEGIAGYQGFVIGAPYYLVLMSEIKDGYLENAGYICEDMILKLLDMGLDNCWISFKNSDAVKLALGVDSDKQPIAVLAYGFGKPEKSRTHLDIKSQSDVDVVKREGHKDPKIETEKMVYFDNWGQKADLSDIRIDEGLSNAFYAASLAPTFLNRQSYRFILDGGRAILVQVHDELTDAADEKQNHGVVMLNFASVLSERRSHQTVWILGQPEKNYELPEGCEIVGYCEV